MFLCERDRELCERETEREGVCVFACEIERSTFPRPSLSPAGRCVLSETMHLFMSLRKSTPPQNCQLNVLISDSEN